jgi:uncharacterized DUF497 family protein
MIEKRFLFDGIHGFDWDFFNTHKNISKHNVLPSECEQIFFNVPLVLADDLAHGDEEEDRYLAMGRTNDNRKLFIVFAIRNKKIRPISFRDMTKAERSIYEKHK